VFYRNTSDVKQYHTSCEQPNNTKTELQQEDFTPNIADSQETTEETPPNAEAGDDTDVKNQDASPERRYPSRNHKPPDRLDL
jgi:hypothetical protein